VGQLLRHSTTADTVSSNHVPWLIIGICSVTCMVLLFSIRLLLARENKRRDAEPLDYSYDDVYIMKVDDEGKRVEVKVSKVRV
jgi:MFS transporter, ACS family, allantoate permease